MSKGYVYVLSNPSMPGLVKIGKTTRLAGMRAVELYQTGVPTPFRVEHERLSPDCAALEREIHGMLGEHRVSPCREFFATTAAETIDCIDALLEEQIAAIVNEYLPDHAVVDTTYAVLPHEVQRLAADAGVHQANAATAITMMTADELLPALKRWQEAIGGGKL